MGLGQIAGRPEILTVPEVHFFNRRDQPMSALGQKQTWRRPGVMSALPPKADIGLRLFDVRFVPIADIASSLFDHLVGGSEKQRRYCKVERFGGLDVDDQLEFGRLLHRQFTSLCASKYAINVSRGFAPRVR
jgi:hypothetical protein